EGNFQALRYCGMIRALAALLLSKDCRSACQVSFPSPDRAAIFPIWAYRATLRPVSIEHLGLSLLAIQSRKFLTWLPTSLWLLFFLNLAASSIACSVSLESPVFTDQFPLSATTVALSPKIGRASCRERV